jgi:hypothetical protein
MSEDFQEPKDVSEKSPFAGCAIMITALLVVVFLIVFSVVVLFRQFNEIAKFTGDKPVKVEIEKIDDREVELNQLAEKIELFRIAVVEDKSAVLELNASEMNLAIAAYAAFKDLRGNLRVREISKDGMSFDISFKLNGKPRLAKGEETGIMASDPRYLNGTLTGAPALLNKEVVLRVKEIDVSYAEVPRGFIEQMSPYRITERYVGKGDLGRVMAGLTDVSLGEGVIRFEKVAGKITMDTITAQDVDQASHRLFRFLGIAASVFLFCVVLILVIGFRAKKRREKLGSES